MLKELCLKCLHNSAVTKRRLLLTSQKKQLSISPVATAELIHYGAVLQTRSERWQAESYRQRYWIETSCSGCGNWHRSHMFARPQYSA